MVYEVEWTETVTRRGEVRANTKAEAIAMVKMGEYDYVDDVAFSTPRSVKVIEANH